MTTWRLTRAIVVALAFLSVTASLAAVPERGLSFWHLYFSPVMIAALSFGVVGALCGTLASVFGVLSLYYRFYHMVWPAGSGSVSLASGTASATLDLTSLSQNPGSAVWIRAGEGLVGLGSGNDLLAQAVLGVMLMAGLGVLVGWLVDENRLKDQRYQEEARTDGLTGVGNYRRLMDALSEEIARAVRFRRKLAFLMIDVDALKPFNDTYGHQVGDAILRQVGQTLRAQVREIDVVCRYGGDEFGVILLEATHDGAVAAGERLRHAVEAHVMPIRGSDARVSVSVGGALYPENGEAPADLIAAADLALYQAKLRGKNQLMMASSPSDDATVPSSVQPPKQ